MLSNQGGLGDLVGIHRSHPRSVPVPSPMFICSRCFSKSHPKQSELQLYDGLIPRLADKLYHHGNILLSEDEILDFVVSS